MSGRLFLSAGVAAMGLVAGAASGQVYQRFLGNPPDIREHQNATAWTPNDGVVTAGFHIRPPEMGPFVTEQLVTRHRDDGAAIWQYRYPSNFQTEFATAIQRARPTVANGMETLIVGGFSYPTTFDVNVSLMRLDATGFPLWSGNYFGGSKTPDPTSQTPMQWASVTTAEAFDPPTGRGVLGVPSGFVLVTTWLPDQGGNTSGQFLRTDEGGNLVSMRFHFPIATQEQDQVAFTDVREDRATNTFVVAGTYLRVTQPTPGGPAVTQRWPLFVRLDAFGNLLQAFAYAIPSVDGAEVEATGWSIEIDRESGDVFLSGPAGVFGAGTSGMFVMRITPAGVPVWTVAYKDFRPAVATLALDDKGRLSVSGTDRATSHAPAPSIITLDAATGANIFRRVYFPPGAFRATDAVDLRGPRDGWALVGLADASPNPGAAEDIHILRTDDAGRTGCFEERLDPGDAQIEAEIIQLSLLPAQEDIFFFRDLQRVDPMMPENPLCVGSCACPGDANFDGVVDFNDINEVLGNWLAVYAPGTGPGDANCDGVVDFNDINEVLANWLNMCP